MIQMRLGKHKREKAQGMVEFALILPILLLVILGIVEFGRLLFFYSSITSASREAARYGAAVGEISGVDRYEDCAGIRDAARRAGTFAAIEDVDITIQYDDGTNLKDAVCPPTATIGLADRIVVTVSKNFSPIVPIVNIPPIPITSTTARTIIKEVGVKGTPVPTDPPPGSNSPTPTATHTPTFTPTDTPTDTPTPTATNTGTMVPTATPTDGPTPTNTSSPTPTNTPVPICGLEFRNFQQPSNSKITWDLYNNTGTGVLPVTVLGLSLNFPDNGGRELYQIDFGGANVWNGTTGSTATVNPGDWVLNTEGVRYIGVGETKTFTLYFNKNMDTSGYTILVVTDNCVDPVSGSH